MVACSGTRTPPSARTPRAPSSVSARQAHPTPENPNPKSTRGFVQITLSLSQAMMATESWCVCRRSSLRSCKSLFGLAHSSPPDDNFTLDRSPNPEGFAPERHHTRRREKEASKRFGLLLRRTYLPLENPPTQAGGSVQNCVARGHCGKWVEWRERRGG